MIYSSNDPMALHAMEDARLGGFDPYAKYDGDSGGDEVKEECPYCGAEEPEYYLHDKDRLCLGCSECVARVTTIRGLHT